jgi:hypothetical protein
MESAGATIFVLLSILIPSIVLGIFLGWIMKSKIIIWILLFTIIVMFPAGFDSMLLGWRGNKVEVVEAAVIYLGIMTWIWFIFKPKTAVLINKKKSRKRKTRR